MVLVRMSEFPTGGIVRELLGVYPKRPNRWHESPRFRGRRDYAFPARDWHEFRYRQ